MHIRIYTDIIISGDQFSIKEKGLLIEEKQKIYPEGCAFTTLKRIEEAMCKGLKYLTTIDDSYSGMTQTNLRKLLMFKAEAIRNNYLNKSQSISYAKRFLGDVVKKEHDIQSLYERIENLAAPHPVFDLPNELIQYISGFLKVSDLGKLAQLNRHANTHVKQAEVQRAREYGYKDDGGEAKDYLKSLFQGIDILVKEGFTPEEYVVRRGKWSFWRYVDSEATLRNIKCLNSELETVLKAHFSEALLVCAKKGRLETVRVLLRLGANPNIRNNDGCTPLRLAKWDKELISLLLDHGADPNITSNNGNVTLCKNSTNPKITELLCQKGAKVNLQNGSGYTALHFAAKYGQIETVRVLLRLGANPNIRNNNGDTPLRLAKWNKKLISLLLNHGADPNIANNNGKITLCKKSTNPKITELLCQKGANVNLQNGSGCTALHFAAMYGQIKTVRVLLKLGALPNILNNQGQTPLMLTSSRRIKELLQLNYFRTSIES